MACIAAHFTANICCTINMDCIELQQHLIKNTPDQHRLSLACSPERLRFVYGVLAKDLSDKLRRTLGNN